MFLRKLSGAYAGGGAGTLVALGVLWLLGRAGLTGRFDISLRADLTPGALYWQLVWGGIWGLLFLLPFWKGYPVRRGILFSLAPVAAVLLLVFPRWGKGYFGLEYGSYAPLLVLALGLLWGTVAALWHKAI